MARFLFVLPRFHTNALPWVRILRGSGHEIAVQVLRLGHVEDHRLVSPDLLPRSFAGRILAKVLPRKADPDYYAIPGVLAYRRILNECSPDVVLVRGLSRYACRMAALVTCLMGRRLVIYDQEDAQPHRGSGTWLRRAAMACMGVPHFTVRRYMGTPPTDRARALTIPFGAPRASSLMEREAAKRIARPVEVPRILMVGKYRPRKGHAVLIDALTRLAPAYRFEVTFCAEESGPADVSFRETLERRVAASGLKDRTRFLANLPRDAILQEYERHQIFVLPSLDEPAAVSPVEAVWSGCVAMMDRRSGTRSYLPPDEKYAFDARDPDMLAVRLETLLRDPELLRQARQECLDHIAAIASDELIAERFAMLIQASKGPRDLNVDSS